MEEYKVLRLTQRDNLENQIEKALNKESIGGWLFVAIASLSPVFTEAPTMVVYLILKRSRQITNEY